MKKTFLDIIEESEIQKYWDNLSKEYGKKPDDVERAWRETEMDLDKNGIRPDSRDYRMKLMMGTRDKLKEAEINSWSEIKQAVKNKKMDEMGWDTEYQKQLKDLENIDKLVTKDNEAEVVRLYKKNYSYKGIKDALGL